MKNFLLALMVIYMLVGCNEKKNKEVPPVEMTVEGEMPNIILLMADDQGWGDTGYNNHPYLITPNLDTMVANGAEFTRFYAASSVCSPTRGSVMTGRHPERFGICFANCGHIKSQEITLGEMVKEKGYTTGHFGKWHLGTLTKDILDSNRGGIPKNEKHYAPPSDHGFDVSFVTESKVPTWNPMVTPPKTSEDVNEKLIEGEPFGTYYWNGPDEIETENLEGDDSRVIMDRAIPFIEGAAKENKPFLSIIWFHTPHLPVLTGKKYTEQYTGFSNDQKHYYGVLTALDEQIGRLRNKLRKLGISDNTLLFYTSDNGPEGNSVSGRTQGITNGLRGRKRSLYEGGVRVPGIMEWPSKIKRGSKVNAPCFTSDYFPTIANILNIDIAKYKRPYDGVDILPLALGIEKNREKEMAFTIQKQAALIKGNYKIYSANAGSSFELYNIVEDPGETKDLSETKTVTLNELTGLWKSWKKSQKKSANGDDYQ